MRILYVSGGSAGHLAPLVAVERAVKEMDPKTESLFLCSDRPEDADYLKSEGAAFKVLPRPKKSFSGMKALIDAYRESKKILKDFKPDVVFSKGSSVSVPACFAAKKLGIPIVIHESDAVMGSANRIVAKWTDTVCVGFKEAASGQRLAASLEEATNRYPLHATRYIHTGNPLRPHINEGSRDEALRITKLSGKKPIMLVIGGSQGAQALNEAVIKDIDRLLKVCDIMHLTGKGKAGAAAHSGYWSKEFAHEELPHLYAAADFALSRAGAGSIGELAANKVPTILVPIEGLANDHQMWNARAAKASSGCTMLRQYAVGNELADAVEWLATDLDSRKKMSQSIQQLHHPDASRRIAEILFECIARRAPRL